MTEEVVLPETETEERLLKFAADLLGIPGDRLSVTANLLSLGLSSISVMRLSAQISMELDIHVSVADLMKNPTIREIAGSIDKGTSDADTIRVTAHEKQPYYPITENQRGLIIEWQLHPDATQYNLPEVVIFEHTKAEELAAAVQKAVEAHSFLKSRFDILDGDIVQVSHDEESVEVRITKLSQTPDMNFFRSRVYPFDLFRDRLYRLEVYTCGDTCWLFMDIHHTVFDGLSDGVLLSDVRAALKGESLLKKTVTAYDYALYEQDLKQSDAWRRAEDHFDELLSDAAVASLPDSEIIDGVETGMVERMLPRQKIDSFCARAGVTAGSFFQAAFAETIRRISREDKPMYTTISNGRSADARLQHCVGMFVRTLPVVCLNGDKQTTAEYVKAFHDQLQKSYELEYYPYTAIVARHRLKAEMMFAWQAGINGEEMQDIIDFSLDERQMPIDVTAWPEGEGYRLIIAYDGMRYGNTEMERLLSAVVNVAFDIATKGNMDEVCLLNEDQERS